MRTDASQSKVALSTKDEAEAQPKDTFPFMDLPKDVRVMIYDFVLAPEDVHVRWRWQSAVKDLRFDNILTGGKERPPKAQVQLFQVCKAVNEEARHHYLANNVFHIMPNEIGVPYVGRPVHQPGESFAVAEGPTRLSIAFDRRAVDLAASMDDLIDYADHQRIEKPQWTHEEWRSMLHDELQEKLLDRCWWYLIDTIHSLRLQYLEINLQNCTCPCGCRSLVQDVMRRLCDPWRDEALPRTIKFLGTRDAHERRLCKMWVEEVGWARPEILYAGVLLGIHDKSHLALWSGVHELHVDSREEILETNPGYGYRRPRGALHQLPME